MVRFKFLIFFLFVTSDPSFCLRLVCWHQKPRGVHSPRLRPHHPEQQTLHLHRGLFFNVFVISEIGRKQKDCLELSLGCWLVFTFFNYCLNRWVNSQNRWNLQRNWACVVYGPVLKLARFSLFRFCKVSVRPVGLTFSWEKSTYACYYQDERRAPQIFRILKKNVKKES